MIAVVWLADVGHSLKEGLFMFWETLWALVFGFALSGAVQAFISKEAMQRSLGNHGPKAVARASGYGMLSSSCSYAASAMAKSLFQKGADLVSAMAFMFASTNLVLELGIVILILLGWQFTVGEFVGGAIMILLLVVVGGLLLRGPAVQSARRRLDSQRSDDQAVADGIAGTGHGHGDGEPVSKNLTSIAGWADAAAYTVADLKMLRRELVVGYAVAGFLTVLVPLGWWNALFVHGHGIWTILENAFVGPLIALLSSVCSVGNVPLAAALWHGGISFGGVIAFIFADLIAMPLILIYLKYYGIRLTLRLVTLFYGVMTAAGLAVEVLFSLAGIVPHVPRHLRVPMSHFSWDYTTWLDLVALAVSLGLYWLYRNRDRLGGGSGLALDPVCGMQVSIQNAPARAHYDTRTLYFCSDHCLARFNARPERYAERTSRSRRTGRRSEPRRRR